MKTERIYLDKAGKRATASTASKIIILTYNDKDILIGEQTINTKGGT